MLFAIRTAIPTTAELESKTHGMLSGVDTLNPNPRHLNKLTTILLLECQKHRTRKTPPTQPLVTVSSILISNHHYCCHAHMLQAANQLLQDIPFLTASASTPHMRYINDGRICDKCAIHVRDTCTAQLLAQCLAREAADRRWDQRETGAPSTHLTPSSDSFM